MSLRPTLAGPTSTNYTLRLKGSGQKGPTFTLQKMTPEGKGIDREAGNGAQAQHGVWIWASLSPSLVQCSQEWTWGGAWLISKGSPGANSLWL